MIRPPNSTPSKSTVPLSQDEWLLGRMVHYRRPWLDMKELNQVLARADERL